jgi:prepilin-type N-terminal cleavage/methylation domain-containing protein
MELRNKGFSLIELIVVIAIIAISASLATLNFNQWVKKSNIERQTKELFSDLNEARLKSMYMKKRHSIVFQPTSYIFKVYSTDNDDRVSGGEKVYSKTTANQMTKASGNSLADRIIEFDIRGFTSDVETISFNPINSGAGFDCIVISNGRTNLGQMGSGNVCIQR